MPGKLLITGASGKLGGYLMREAAQRKLDTVAWGHSWIGKLFGQSIQSVDLGRPDEVWSVLEASDPACIIHAAALSEVQACHQLPDLADRINREATGVLADWCHRRGRRMIFVSTDMVFDGESAPYSEYDEPGPTSVYGSSKRSGELQVLQFPRQLVVRAALMMGPTLTLRRSFFDQLVDKLKGGETQRLYTDEWRSILSLRSAARAMLDLTERSTEGVLHLAGRQLISRYELGQCVARALDLPADGLQKGQRSEYRGAEPRQKNLALTCERLDKELPDWDPGDLETEIRAMMAERTL